MIEGRLGRRVFKGQGSQPRHVTDAPMTLGVVIAKPAAQQELAHAMTGAHQVLAHGVAATTQVAQRFVRFVGGLHLGQQPRAQQLGQLARIPPIGLDPLPGLDRDQGGGHHLADHPLGLELALQGIAQGAGLVTAAYFTGYLAVQPPRQAPDRTLLVGLLPADRLLPARDQHRDVDPLLVCVQPHPGDTVRAHDRLLSYAALAPQALTRDRAWRHPRHRRLLSREARPYDREPVVPYGLRARTSPTC